MVTTPLRCAFVVALVLTSSCNPSKKDSHHGGVRNPPLKVSDIGNKVIYLKPSECNELGGTIKYEPMCRDYSLTCSVKTADGTTHESCIDELDAPR